MSDCLPTVPRLSSRAQCHPVATTNPLNDPYSTLPGHDSGWHGYSQADASAAEATVLGTVTGGPNNVTYAGYGHVVANGFAPGEVAPASCSLPPPPAVPPKFDSQGARGIISFPPLEDGAFAKLALDTFLKDAKVPSPSDSPPTSDEIDAIIAMYESICSQPQQPEASIQDNSVCQGVAPVGYGGQSLGYTPNDNTTVFPPQPLGAHPGPVGLESAAAPVRSTITESPLVAIPAETFNVQEFQNDVAHLDSASGSFNTGWNTHSHVASPIVNHQHNRAIQPATPSNHPEQPAGSSSLRRTRTRTARLRAMDQYTQYRVPTTVETNGFSGPQQLESSFSRSASAPHASQVNMPLMPVNTLPEPTHTQQSTVRSPSNAPLPTPPPNVPEPAVPALTPFEKFGNLPKRRWILFRTSHALLDMLEVKKPSPKQLLCCQYIDPATRMRCHQTKCNVIGRPHAGKGFPIEGLEDYIRHLWLHRQLERQIRVQKAENKALLTSWADDVLDAQKALDDANGVEYPYNP
ncbi:hypothetical protein FRC08_002679 [Ceratobasidium sp. 394]|nr:hypothetical protein FRC08_002679 [Ceratobasidium sp. 394]